LSAVGIAIPYFLSALFVNFFATFSISAQFLGSSKPASAKAFLLYQIP
ncbi:conserved hypothetical protein, partial [Listeria monocytogenes FSL F2-208]